MQQNIAVNANRPGAMRKQQEAGAVRINSALIEFSRVHTGSFPQWMTSGN